MRGVKSLSFVAITIAIAACSSKDNNNASNDGGSNNNNTDGSTLSDGQASDGGGGGPSTPAACEASITYRQRCAETAEAKSDDCANGRRQTCDKLLATERSEYQAAYAECTTPQLSCDDGPDVCITQKLIAVGATPTAAQNTLRDHFCATCASDTCKDDFYKLDVENGNGVGYNAFIASDAVVQMIDSACTGAALQGLIADAGGDCSAAYGACQSDTAGSALPDDPDTCYPPYTGDDDDSGSTDDAGPDAPADAPTGG